MCYACGEVGHLKAMCPLKNERCIKCFKIGHVSSVCWHKALQCHQCHEIGHIKVNCPSLTNINDDVEEKWGLQDSDNSPIALSTGDMLNVVTSFVDYIVFWLKDKKYLGEEQVESCKQGLVIISQIFALSAIT